MFKTFKRFKEDIECVVEPIDGKGGIFIGNLEAAENINILKKNQIKTIFTAADRIILSHSEEDIPYYKQIPAKDYDQFDLKKYFDESVEFIDKGTVKGNVLVHCGAGISRSATIVLAYLIKKKGMSYQQAYNEVKSKRAIVTIVIFRFNQMADLLNS